MPYFPTLRVEIIQRCCVNTSVGSRFTVGNIAISFHLLGVHDMQQASHKAEPGYYKHVVNDTHTEIPRLLQPCDNQVTRFLTSNIAIATL